MKSALSEEETRQIVRSTYKLCHIGGMSLHKGYQLLRRAVHELPPNLPIQFTIVDHRLIPSADHYNQHLEWISSRFSCTNTNG